MELGDETDDSLVTIPGLGPGEVMAVESLLQAAGIEYLSLPCSSVIQILGSDLAEVKELLADFRIETPAGDLVPIPWEY